MHKRKMPEMTKVTFTISLKVLLLFISDVLQELLG